MSIIENLAEYYDKEAEKFHNTRQRHRPEFDVLVAEIKKRFPRKKKFRILEIGCGSGRLYGVLDKALPTKEFSYTGIDISRNLISKAKELYPEATWKVANMTDFLENAKQESYDLIIGIASFHHLPSVHMRLTTANQIYRALAYDGFCYLTNWSDSDWFRKRFRKAMTTALFKSMLSLGVYKPMDLFLPRKSDKSNKVFYRYYHIFTLRELEKIAKIAGFGEIDQFFLTNEGERTQDKSASRNSCSIWSKNVFLS